MFSFIYTEVFYKPLLNSLVFLTGVVPGHSLGIAIIILTILVKLILFPIQHKTTKTQTAMKELEPEITKIKEKYKNKKEEQARLTMDLYKKHGISPFSGFFLLLIQLPLLIALYRVFLNGFNGDMAANLYSFIFAPENVATLFLTINLSEPSLILAITAATTQYYQIQLSMAKKGKEGPKSEAKSKQFGQELQQVMKKQLPYIMPGIVLMIGIQFPSALVLYWTVMNLFAIVHESVVRKTALRLYGEQNKQ